MTAFHCIAIETETAARSGRPVWTTAAIRSGGS